MSRNRINVAYGFDVFTVPTAISHGLQEEYDEVGINEWLKSEGYDALSFRMSRIGPAGWLTFIAKETFIELFDNEDHCNTELRYINAPAVVAVEQLKRLRDVFSVDEEAAPGPIGFLGLTDVYEG